ncbi:hypothetical protein PanWU01x14_024120 [Parasponia andersonii]|uniref:Uncharacterized protein n=1 Tax=Parasponia andersonii TaxID=3476 RepID=A0A2P5DWI7_PARAD|nr:hypothetical protein PanWU01x14_024120 [Parasponia andersonii]
MCSITIQCVGSETNAYYLIIYTWFQDRATFIAHIAMRSLLKYVAQSRRMRSATKLLTPKLWGSFSRWIWTGQSSLWRIR